MEPRRVIDTSYPPAISATLWKLGLITNCPVDELMNEQAFETLSELGPAAKNAVPMIEKALKQNPDNLDAALALCRIDPDEGRRLGLPGLFIICPDKY